MRQLRTIMDAELEQAYNTIFTEAFPPAELKPLRAMREMIADGIYYPFGLFEDGELLGCLFLWGGDEPYYLIDYLCVQKNRRNGGIGAEILAAMLEKFPDAVLFGEAEAPTGDPKKDKMILRRLGFYDRCGAKVLDYDTALFGVHYKTLAWAGQMPDSTTVMEHHAGFYRRRFTPENYASAIQIPLREGELPFAPMQWTE